MSYEKWKQYYDAYGNVLIALLKDAQIKDPAIVIPTAELRKAMTPRIKSDFPALSDREAEEVFVKLMFWLPMNSHAKGEVIDGIPCLKWEPPTPEKTKGVFGFKKRSGIDL